MDYFDVSRTSDLNLPNSTEYIYTINKSYRQGIFGIKDA